MSPPTPCEIRKNFMHANIILILVFYTTSLHGVVTKAHVKSCSLCQKKCTINVSFFGGALSESGSNKDIDTNYQNLHKTVTTWSSMLHFYAMNNNCSHKNNEFIYRV